MAIQNSQDQRWLFQDQPSPRIDAAVCDLLTKIQNHSNSCLDVSWVQLTEGELEELAIKLIVHLTNELHGQLLAELISEIRDYEESFEDLI